MSLYRSESGRAAIRRWCEDELSSVEGLARSMVITSLGPTHLATLGDGPSILVIPGNNMNGATTIGLLRSLATDHEVIVADVPGQPGLSAPERPGRGRIAAYGQWLDELLDREVAGPVVLVGHSLGAAVALSATVSSRIRALVALSPAGLAPVHLTGRLLTTTMPWMLRPNARRSGALVTLMVAGGGPPDPLLTEWFTLVARHSRTVGAPGPLPPEALRRWRTIPRAVVTGAEDVFFPPHRLSGASREHLGVEVLTVAGAGHLLPHEDPAAAAEAIRSAISGPQR